MLYAVFYHLKHLRDYAPYRALMHRARTLRRRKDRLMVMRLAMALLEEEAWLTAIDRGANAIGCSEAAHSRRGVQLPPEPSVADTLEWMKMWGWIK